MKLQIYFGELKPNSAVQQDVTNSIESTFEHFRTRIRQVNITFNDANGPKGGVDKECRCVVHLKSMAPIVIQDRDESFINLLNRVLKRAEHTLSERISLAKNSFRTRGSLPMRGAEQSASTDPS